MAALGGTWLTAVFGFAGLSLRSNQLAFDPKLPANWRSLAFRIQWRGRRLKIRIDAQDRLLQASLEAGDPIDLLVCSRRHELHRNQATAFPLNQKKIHR